MVGKFRSRPSKTFLLTVHFGPLDFTELKKKRNNLRNFQNKQNKHATNNNDFFRQSPRNFINSCNSTDH